MTEQTRQRSNQSPPGQEATERPPPWATSRRVIPIAILCITFITFISVVGFEFVYDDDGQILGNQNIQSWAKVPHYFTHHSWSHLYANVAGTYYRPLFLIWLLLNHSLFGFAPAGWHLTTLALHLGCTVAVYWLATRRQPWRRCCSACTRFTSRPSPGFPARPTP
jgi:hypothetical protein